MEITGTHLLVNDVLQILAIIVLWIRMGYYRDKIKKILQIERLHGQLELAKDLLTNLNKDLDLSNTYP